MYWEAEPLPTLYVSVDMESDGPAPYRNNLLSLGAVAYVTGQYTVNRRMGMKCRALRRLPTFFSQNVKPQRGAMPDEATMKNFWFKDDHHMALYQATQCGQLPLPAVMESFVHWLGECKRYASNGYPWKFEVVPVARPGAFDFHWITSAFQMAEMDNPFGNDGLDMQSYLLGARRGFLFPDASASKWKESWKNSRYPHTHIAVEDAAAQGEVFRNMFEETLNWGPRARYALSKVRRERGLALID